MRSDHIEWRNCAVILLLSMFVGGAALHARPVDFNDPPQGLFFDDYMVAEMMGSKVGYIQVQLSREGDVIHTSALTAMTLARNTAPVSINEMESSTETIDGRPLEFTSQMEASFQKLQKHGVISDGKVKVSSGQYGEGIVNTFDFPAGALMTWGTFLAQQKHGYKQGTEYDLTAYVPAIATDTAVTMHVVVHEKEKIDVDGQKVEAVRTTQVLKLPGMPMGINSTVWVDDDGQIIKNITSMMGMDMIMTRATREQALADFSPPEFFAPTTIDAGRRLDRKAANRIDFVLAPIKDAFPLTVPPQTGMQTVTDQADGKIHLTVKRIDCEPLRTIEPQKFGKEFEETLTANAMINCDDPVVVAMAKEAKGDATMPYEIADRLRKYVTTAITDKNLDVGFATASEVCRNRAGDCSEHAVLLAALGRACGIPTRVATGLVYVPYFGGQDNVFGFHMWTQFRIGDRWVDFDAAQRESDCNPTHIAFSVDSLHSAGLGQIAFGLANVIGNLDLKIAGIEPDQQPMTQPTE